MAYLGFPDSDPAQPPSEREQLLVQRLRLLDRILDGIPNPVFHKDPQGRFRGCNRAFAAAVGVSQAEVLGKTGHDFLAAETAEEVADKDRQLLETGETQVFPALVRRKLAGPWQVLVHKAALRDDDGQFIGIIGSLVDLTEQKRVEAALRQSEELLSTINRHVMDLMSIVDCHGRRIFTSPSYSTVLGYSAAELEAKQPRLLVHPEDRERMEHSLELLFQGAASQSLEYRLQHRDGSWLFFESRATLIPGSEPHCAQALIVARDITARKAAELERKAMEVQLRHGQKLEAIGSLAAGIAHEINTPTQYIGDNATFLKDALGRVMDFLSCQRRFLEDHAELEGIREEAQQALKQFEDLDLDYLAVEVPRALQQTLEGVARVTAIVSAMKDFSHPGGEDKVATLLNRSIESTLTVSRNEWKYVAELDVDLDPGLGPVLCFPGEINQAILNLVVNAAHAIEESLGGRDSGRRGRIRVSTRQLGQEVEITVADDGAGIPADLRERIFEPFFTTKPVGRGTGQGLAIVHSVVVDKHGGRLQVESEPGRGTVFHLFLPLNGEGRSGKGRS